ncbi:MAG TPA: hypothetical protein VK898_09085, partial [Chloroflexota bacterium]|nr:hypothetical protein [Chloroflexota bacterium]
IGVLTLQLLVLASERRLAAAGASVGGHVHGLEREDSHDSGFTVPNRGQWPVVPMLHSWDAGLDNAFVRQADAARSAWGRRRADVPPGVKPLE